MTDGTRQAWTNETFATKTGQIAERLDHATEKVIKKNALGVCSQCRTHQPIWLMCFTGWAMPKVRANHEPGAAHGLISDWSLELYIGGCSI